MGSFRSGFFGFFGVCAALLAVIVAGLLWLAISSRVSADQVMAGRADPRDYAKFCDAAASDLAGQHGIVTAHVSAIQPGLLSKAPVRILCEAETNLGLIPFAVELSCSSPTDSCAHVDYLQIQGAVVRIR